MSIVWFILFLLLYTPIIERATLEKVNDILCDSSLKEREKLTKVLPNITKNNEYLANTLTKIKIKNERDLKRFCSPKAQLVE